MTSFLNRIVGDKQEWKAIEARARVLDLFEDSAAAGRSVLDVTGSDVAAFCDARLSGTPYTDRWRATLNRDVAAKLAE